MNEENEVTPTEATITDVSPSPAITDGSPSPTIIDKIAAALAKAQANLKTAATEAAITDASSSPAIDKIATALAKAQANLHTVAFDSSNPHFKSKFASYDAIVDHVRSVFGPLGISVLHLPFDGGPDTTGLQTIFLHESGQWIASRLVMPLKPGANNQDKGTALSYACRYALRSMAAIGTAEDDDGNGAAGRNDGTSRPPRDPKPTVPPQGGGRPPTPPAPTKADVNARWMDNAKFSAAIKGLVKEGGPIAEAGYADLLADFEIGKPEELGTPDLRKQFYEKVAALKGGAA